MIIFKSVLTTFKTSIVLRGSCEIDENWLEPEIEPPYGNLAFPNL
jgi:hypothetical protein